MSLPPPMFCPVKKCVDGAALEALRGEVQRNGFARDLESNDGIQMHALRSETSTAKMSAFVAEKMQCSQHRALPLKLRLCEAEMTAVVLWLHGECAADLVRAQSE